MAEPKPPKGDERKSAAVTAATMATPRPRAPSIPPAPRPPPPPRAARVEHREDDIPTTIAPSNAVPLHEQTPPPMRRSAPHTIARARTTGPMSAVARGSTSEIPRPRTNTPVSSPRDVATSVLPASASPDSELQDRTNNEPKKNLRPPIELVEHQHVGRFELIRELARGGMGQVFLARDTKLGRKVAIKFLLHADPNFASRFFVEARATARCTHENIVTIYEVGEHDGLPYMVLEYLEGKTLSQLLENGTMAPKPFVEIVISVVRALERAHEHGIVHRDLKPSNIFITDRGVVKVLDFGVAKLFDSPIDVVAASATSATSATSQRPPTDASGTYVTFSGSGTLVGTQPYMSPEQWGVGVVDETSDIWAIGILCWRALCKVHPAGTMNREKLRARTSDLDTPLPSIGSRDPSLSAKLVAIIDHCLAKRKAERYQRASELLADLRTYAAPNAHHEDDGCPFRGLASFGERDAKYFFGRSAEIRTAMRQLETWPLLAVIGPSGVGKSSFVHAGLIPAMRSAGKWEVHLLRPGRSPLQSLVSVVDGQVDGLQLCDAPGMFGDVLRKRAARSGHNVLLVVDQLEELFTLSTDDEARRTFLAALLATADDPSAPVRVVLSMRADFLDRLANHKQFLAELSRGLFFLSAPDRDNLRETIVRPVELAGYAFDDTSIVDEMIEAANSRGALPLLQFAATRMWDLRDRKSRQLTRSAYATMGGVGGAFARHADEVAAAVAPQNQLLLKAIMTRLVTPEGTRAVVDHRELLGLSADQGDVEMILDQLVQARLIHLHRDPSRGTTVEIVHEVLITEWPMLARWLEDNQALRGFMHELRQAVKQWVSRGNPGDLVWRGATARDALGMAQRHVLDLSAAEREFLDAARREVRRVRRRKVAVIASIFCVLALVIAGGSVAIIQIWNAQALAEDKAVAAASEATRARQAEAVAAAEAARAKEAEAEVARQLAEVTKKEEQRAEAEAVAVEATASVVLSREELEKALAESQRERIKAQELATRAAAAAETARKANEETRAANAKTQALLAAERARVKQLELEKAKIATGGLK